MLMLLSVHVTRVLFLVMAGKFHPDYGLLHCVYVQTMTSHLKHSTSTSCICYTSLKVVSCEEVTTSCCVGCVQTWVSSRSWPEKRGEER